MLLARDLNHGVAFVLTRGKCCKQAHLLGVLSSCPQLECICQVPGLSSIRGHTNNKGLQSQIGASYGQRFKQSVLEKELASAASRAARAMSLSS